MVVSKLTSVDERAEISLSAAASRLPSNKGLWTMDTEGNKIGAATGPLRLAGRLGELGA